MIHVTLDLPPRSCRVAHLDVHYKKLYLEIIQIEIDNVETLLLPSPSGMTNIEWSSTLDYWPIMGLDSYSIFHGSKIKDT